MVFSLYFFRLKQCEASPSQGVAERRRHLGEGVAKRAGVAKKKGVASVKASPREKVSPRRKASPKKKVSPEYRRC